MTSPRIATGLNSLGDNSLNMATLSTQPVKGMRDILGKSARTKKKIEETISKLSQTYGFDPMDLPLLEKLETLTIKGGGGEEAEKELYTLEDQSKRKLGLRFEFTTSLARVVAGNPDLPKPIKSLNVGKVYRYDNPQAMRYREFTQADCDIIGTKSIYAEAECLSLGVTVMRTLGFENAIIRVNDRRLINSLLSIANIPEENAKDAMRIMDKLDKIGPEGVKKELEKNNLSTEILEYLSLSLPQLRKKIETVNGNTDGLSSLEELFDILSPLKKFVQFDASLVRGLEYYTGTVFEINAGANVSVGGGGRYDTLIKTLGGPDIPAVGISFGVDRLMDLLVENEKDADIELFVIPIGKTTMQSFELTQKLRAAGFSTSMDLMSRSIGKNMGWADTQQIPFVILLGEDELKKNTVNVRDMKTGTEKQIKMVPFEELSNELKKLVGKEK